jgi:uroporphyrin-III C-methyltransferase
MKSHPSAAKVFIVGAGPGDPELLTVKALHVLQASDAVVYDRLISDEILQLIPEGVIRLFVGKSASEHSLEQPEINKLLVLLAKKGKQVVRLKGGDPFMFGRGGEEAEYLAKNGVSFEIVPGVTSASGCAAYAGIPLTHRDYASSVRFITGHFKTGKEEWNWAELANCQTTLVVYMGLRTAGYISKNLIANGLPASTPFALIEQGTTKHQRRIIGTLDDIEKQIDLYEVKSPSLLIIGNVVKLAGRMDWFDVVSHPELVSGSRENRQGILKQVQHD